MLPYTWGSGVRELKREQTEETKRSGDTCPLIVFLKTLQKFIYAGSVQPTKNRFGRFL